jgi:hypothetical protein
MSTTSPAKVSQRLRIRNTTGQPQELWIEPLGDRVALSPGVLYEISASDALDEIDFSPDGFVVHGWVTSVASIVDGRRETVWQLPQ